MLALRIRAPHDLALEELPDPHPGPDEVLVEVQAAGICGTDLEVLRGVHEAYRTGRGSFPITPGHEWSGIVRAVGSKVTRFAVGDVVTGETGLGCLRCEVCLRGRHSICPDLVETGIFNRDGAMRQLHVHPEVFTHSAAGLSPMQAAMAEPTAVALHSCRRGRVGVGDKVAVLGCGPIGLLVIQTARACGASAVLATSRSQPKLDKALELGADRVVNVAAEDIRAAADDFTRGKGFDVVLECTGNLEAADEALDIAGRLGRVVIVGAYRSQPFCHDIDRLIGKELDVMGTCGGPHAYADSLDLLRRGVVKAEPIVSHCFALTQYEQAFALAEQGGPDVLKIMLLPAG
ncbi:MAG: zinc-binding dehydrogenase [Armatimonadetes bacterium]|nr:zinc-binding dehydrogenase [Armatimonadota bacterium]